MAKPPTTCEDIIKAWKELDAKSDKPVGADKVATAMGISPFWIAKLFVGKSLTEMKRQHGIRISPQEAPRSDDELFSELDAAVSKHKCIPPWNILNHETGMADGTWKKGNRGRTPVRRPVRPGRWGDSQEDQREEAVQVRERVCPFRPGGPLLRTRRMPTA